MSQSTQFPISPEPDGAKPSRSTADYVDSLTARLRRLAAGQSTGILPFSGLSDGAIYFRAGHVIGAESSRTPPGLTAREVPTPADTSLNGHAETGPGAEPRPGQPDSGLLAPLLRVEPAIDAVLDLVLGQSAIGRFRTGRGRSGPDLITLSGDSLTTELARRLRLVRQMAALVSADTAVSRSQRLRSARVQVSALQWALLIRAGSATTPRDLAWALRRSVFGTTTEVYRLMAQNLLLAADQSGSAPDLTQRDQLSPLEPCPGNLSFLRAVSDEKGDNGMPMMSDMLQHASGSR
jgi:hypothetical protein